MRVNSRRASWAMPSFWHSCGGRGHGQRQTALTRGEGVCLAVLTLCGGGYARGNCQPARGVSLVGVECSIAAHPV